MKSETKKLDEHNRGVAMANAMMNFVPHLTKSFLRGMLSAIQERLAEKLANEVR